MTDVVALARERRAKLAAEVAKLDDFLRTATALAETSEPGDLEDEISYFDSHDEAEHDDELILTEMVDEASATQNIYVGKRIRYRRWMMGMTQEQLGEMIGVDLEMIQDFETGVRRVTTGMLRKIAEVMSEPMSFFLEEADEPEARREERFEFLLRD